MIRRPPRSTQSRSSAASDVYKRQAWHFLFNTLVFVLKIASIDVAATGLGPLPHGTSADPSALVSPARAAVLDQLTAVGGPASVAELAASSGQVYPANDWHERETWDFFGIEFDLSLIHI